MLELSPTHSHHHSPIILQVDETTIMTSSITALDSPFEIKIMKLTHRMSLKIEGRFAAGII